MEFWIPYGETEVPVRVPDGNFYKILEPAKPSANRDTGVLINDCLDKPVGGVSLDRMVKQGGRAGVIVDPLVPRSVWQAAVNRLTSRLANAGISPTNVFLRKRTSHLPSTESAETEGQYTRLDPSHGTFRELGHTGSGTPVSLREEFVDCETRICIGMVTPHFASSFTGGPDSLLPGASSMNTIAKNRSLMMRGSPSHTDFGSNPVLADSMEASRIAGPTYNISFVPDGWGGVDSAFGGEIESSFKEATTRYLQVHTARIDRRPDIVIVSAASWLGMDLYHSVRVLSNVWDIVRKDGTIILVAECSRGIGDTAFLDYARRFEERKALLTELRHRFRLGGHVNLLLSEALERNRIQLVSVLPDYYVRDSFGLKPSRTGSSAVQQAVRVEGKDAKILIVTRGDLTLPTLGSNPD